jgi:predicted phosphate transport protein (TIGR00153 family)
MRTIHRLFGKSPFGPLVQHTRRVHETVELVRPLLEAFFEEDWERCEELYEEISRCEHAADLQKNEIRDHLPKSVFLPVDRGDVLHYLKEQDAIADGVEDLAVMLTLRPLPTPSGLEPAVLELADQVVATVERLVEAGSELVEVFEASFAGPEVDRVLEMVAQVNDQEWEADKRQRRATQQLLQHQDGLDPVSIMLWMHTLEVLGQVANAAENTGDLLRMMLARR